MADIRDPRRPLIVKVGGSLSETGRLPRALILVASAGRPVVVVPGGGSFADKVRNLQHVMKFDDAAAHRLAMLGMHQMAEVFIKIEPQLALAETLDDIARILSDGRIPLWVPLPMMEDDDSVPRNWSTTSDTIAARLAELLGGAPLALLKSVDVVTAQSAEALSVAGVVDRAFPAVIARSGIEWHVFGPSDDAALAQWLEVPRNPRNA